MSKWRVPGDAGFIGSYFACYPLCLQLHDQMVIPLSVGNAGGPGKPSGSRKSSKPPFCAGKYL